MDKKHQQAIDETLTYLGVLLRGATCRYTQHKCERPASVAQVIDIGDEETIVRGVFCLEHAEGFQKLIELVRGMHPVGSA